MQQNERMSQMRATRSEMRKKRRRNRRIWRSCISVMACVVVFCITYALIIPAITMEKEAFCGIEAHVHEESCYAFEKTIVCTPGEEDLPVLHKHDAFCYDGERLICKLPELEGHVHKDGCYETVTTEAHHHDDSCKGVVRGEMICTVAEEEGHSHGDGCYTPGTNLQCTEVEREGHSHGEACYTVSSEMTCTLAEGEGHSHSGDCYQSENVLSCGKDESAGHSHGDGCYQSENVLSCGKNESAGHSHSDACKDADGNLICEQEESEGHSHGDSCYSQQNTLVCTTAEAPAHSHSDGCYTEIKTLLCTTAEAPAHSHGDGCYTETKTLTCTADEDPGHQHGDSCYEQVLSCGKEESEGHAHTDDCYEKIESIVCGKEEQAETVSVTNLICGKSELAPHVHNESCNDAGGNLICTIQNAVVHQHTEECIGAPGEEGNLICEIQVHEHTLPCFSNPKADAETAEDWEKTFAHVTLTGDWSQDVVAIAKTQLGYDESTKNYIVEGEDTIKGYSRYGAWYGVPYGDWCAMFASFCYHYAGVEGVPLDASCPNWINNLSNLGLYKTGADYIPNPGDLIFFDWNANGAADHVGLVAEVKDDGKISTIEGNSGDTVDYHKYDLDDSRILGYGALPQKLTEEEQAAVDAVIALIDELPTYEEIEATVEAFMEAEDEEGEIAYLEELYPKVYAAYGAYAALEERLQEFVTNRDKLLDLEYIWSATTYAPINVWLDGTCGGIPSYYGAANRRITNAATETPITLPTTWEGPTQYDYVLRGWYDIVNGAYYKPGASVRLSDDTVFYADWRPANYDIGQYTAEVSNTVSTDHFITTNMFDYSIIFNMYSTKVDVDISATDHSETWNLVGNRGKSLHNGGREDSLNFSMRDYNTTGMITLPSNNENTANHIGHNNNFHSGENGIAPGILGTTYSADSKILAYLFNKNNNNHILGQEWLGEADHLFHFGTDPTNDETYGYYYYDSELNAAAYNQKAERFYVYDYLEQTTDTPRDSENSGKYADFLPFNAPYSSGNNNGMTVATGSFTGNDTGYRYDANGGSDYRSYSSTNMWFGMQTDIEFFLPNQPGQPDANGNYGNKGMLGNDLIFEFSGDDDVWIFVDGELVLDIGGIHGVMSGSINFATGEVTVGPSYTNTVISPVDYSSVVRRLEGNKNHVLSMYYVERGDSLSNCKVRFNLSPRYTLTIQKEDVLTQQMLDGATFEIFTDVTCKKGTEAQLWHSRADYKAGKTPTNEFVVAGGKASMFGFAAGNTYYLKETTAPEGYGNANGGVNGIIVMTLDAMGNSSYDVIAEPNAEGTNPAPGYTVRGFRVDEDTQEAYIIITNSKNDSQVVDVTVKKNWNDTATTHPNVTAYLLIDGVRSDSVTLNAANNWTHTWKNLPAFKGQDLTTEVEYTVEEGLIPGYSGTITTPSTTTITRTKWVKVDAFEDGKTYLIVSPSLGALSSSGADNLRWRSTGYLTQQSEEVTSEQWKATSGNNGFNLTNDRSVNLRYNNSQITASTADKTGFNYSDGYFYTGRYSYNRRFLSSISNNVGSVSTTSANALPIEIYVAQSETETLTTAADGEIFVITNSPIEEEAEVTVNKIWTDYDGETLVDEELYKTFSIPVKLMADNKDTGLEVELNLQNGWKHVFKQLPRNRTDGAAIQYTVVENWSHEDWKTDNAPTVVDKGNGIFEITVNNVYNRLIDIPVEKIWDENLSEAFRKEIELELYKYDPDDVSAGDQSLSIVGSAIKLNKDNQWKGKFAVPRLEEGEIYYIRETTNGYLVTYSNPEQCYIGGTLTTVGRVVFSEDGGAATVTTVTNQPLQLLPETGGVGTTIYMTGGLLLMTAAALSLFYSQNKRRRKEKYVSSR